MKYYDVYIATLISTAGDRRTEKSAVPVKTISFPRRPAKKILDDWEKDNRQKYQLQANQFFHIVPSSTK